MKCSNCRKQSEHFIRPKFGILCLINWILIIVGIIRGQENYSYALTVTSLLSSLDKRILHPLLTLVKNMWSRRSAIERCLSPRNQIR